LSNVVLVPQVCRQSVSPTLRKALMRRLAERGATTKQIASVSGHKTLKEVERYTAAADQARLARATIEQNSTEEVSNLTPKRV
jgi:integrase